MRDPLPVTDRCAVDATCTENIISNIQCIETNPGAQAHYQMFSYGDLTTMLWTVSRNMLQTSEVSMHHFHYENRKWQNTLTIVHQHARFQKESYNEVKQSGGLLLVSASVGCQGNCRFLCIEH